VLTSFSMTKSRSPLQQANWDGPADGGKNPEAGRVGDGLRLGLKSTVKGGSCFTYLLILGDFSALVV
jgi:hypothetical protein